MRRRALTPLLGMGLLVGLAVGCAEATTEPPGSGPGLDAAVARDGAWDLRPTADLRAAADLLRPPASEMGGIGCLGMVRINELQTGSATTASDEWVELYNPCAQPADLTGATLVYRAATNTTASDTYTLASLTGALAPQAFLLVGGGGYAGMPAADQKFAIGGLAATGGSVGLRDPAGVLIDSVGWGSALNPFVEKAAVTAPAAGHSIARSPDGVDSNDNPVDFKETATPTPRAPNG